MRPRSLTGKERSSDATTGKGDPNRAGLPAKGRAVHPLSPLAGQPDAPQGCREPTMNETEPTKNSQKAKTNKRTPKTKPTHGSTWESELQLETLEPQGGVGCSADFPASAPQPVWDEHAPLHPMGKASFSNSGARGG